MDVFSHTCIRLGRYNLLIVCCATEWLTTPNIPASLVKDGMGVVSKFIQSGELSPYNIVREMLRSTFCGLREEFNR